MSGPELDQLFHALADPTRRAILSRLSHAPASVSALAEPLGVTLTAISQHLRVLETSGLAATQKLGRVRTCRIAEPGFTALEGWIASHRAQWERRLDALGDVLEEDD